MDRLLIHLWYATEAAAAAHFYAGLLPDSRVGATAVLPGTPGGDSELVQFVLAGREFQAISAGPRFRFTPAISVLVRCPSVAEVDRLHAGLSGGGSVLMPLGSYPFSPRYSWVADRYGLTWQLILDEAATAVSVQPAFLFAGPAAGRAAAALRDWADMLPDSAMGPVALGEDGLAAFAEARLAGVPVSAMDDTQGADFSFTEAVSLVLRCEGQQEIDRFSDALSAEPAAEQCGWLKDRYGVSWQLVPTAMDSLLFDGSPAEIARVTRAFLGMRRFDIAALKRARAGE